MQGKDANERNMAAIKGIGMYQNISNKSVDIQPLCTSLRLN